MDEKMLLTREQIEAEGWASFDAWEKEEHFKQTPADSDERHAAYRAFCDRRLCRAQVKKVVEFYQQIPVAGRPMHDVWADFLEALREAAEGEG